VVLDRTYSLAHVEMIMRDQAEKHRDLVARIEEMKAMLQQANIHGEKQELVGLASSLETDVTDFGKPTEQEVLQKLTMTSGMAIVPEDARSEELAEETSEQVTVPAQDKIDALSEELLGQQQDLGPPAEQ
jgi:hypothetical protein